MAERDYTSWDDYEAWAGPDAAMPRELWDELRALFPRHGNAQLHRWYVTAPDLGVDVGQLRQSRETDD